MRLLAFLAASCELCLAFNGAIIIIGVVWNALNIGVSLLLLDSSSDKGGQQLLPWQCPGLFTCNLLLV